MKTYDCPAGKILGRVGVLKLIQKCPDCCVDRLCAWLTQFPVQIKQFLDLPWAAMLLLAVTRLAMGGSLSHQFRKDGFSGLFLFHLPHRLFHIVSHTLQIHVSPPSRIWYLPSPRISLGVHDIPRPCSVEGTWLPSILEATETLTATTKGL